jgi:predicted Rossmann fold flavoprotein
MTNTSPQSAQKIIAIVGGGAAGLISAYFAKLRHSEDRVIIIEKNAYLGAKVIISGGGRCNVTTGLLEVSEVLKNYPRGAKFLRSAIQAFPPQAVIDWFESQGVALKTEPDLRVFPVSNDGHDVVGALQSALEELGVEFLLNQQMIALENSTDANQIEDKFLLKFKDGSKLEANRVILTTGGNAYRHTGSTGDGYAFAKQMGHTITELAPSLSSFYTAEKWIHQLSGLSFKKAYLKFISVDDAVSFDRTGPFLFTHQGISGPAIFALSGYAAYQKFYPEKPAKLVVDFFPEINEDQFGQQLDEKIQDNPNKKIANFLALWVPHSLSEKIVSEILQPQFSDKNLDVLTATHLSKAMRQAIVASFKQLKLHLVGRGAGDEFVTAGGVALDEVDSRTMESKLRRGLFFAGELLDIDGFTGGYNLQASWATGALAGENV